MFRGVPLAHDDVWPFCTSFSGGSRVYYYYAFGKYVALSRDKLADTFHLDNDTNSYWVITDQSNLTGCPYMIGRNPVAGGNCGIKRHAVCSRALSKYNNCSSLSSERSLLVLICFTLCIGSANSAWW